MADGVRFSSYVPYAAIHNEGGKITVTGKMKKFFWAKFKETGEVGWKYMALIAGRPGNDGGFVLVACALSQFQAVFQFNS